MIKILFFFARKIKSALRKLMKKYYNFRVKITARAVGDHLKVNFYSNVSKNTILGNNVNFNGMSISGGGQVRIGNNFHSGKECLMITQIHNYDHGDKIPYDDTYICKDVLIKDNVWLGSRVVILGGVTIGEGAIIQAGSVVVSDIPDYAIAGGHPAKVFKYRDKEHYDKLKHAEKFH
ncbi:acyltransferase [Halanaerobium praevalens]|uniref:Acetyltransferase n=1 Tax=Halanaerobium praevalens (strain ATCC 33744 / DSM 2228 / GSL) TaxID=572479 RepID=E3DNF1_HALPG|nr:acyltransferase [Halanaerobium praevalens]ADO76489.1 acetyltransferase [Halanaerobium praevalens DSM 2228]